jgi:hypothetical protein
MKLSHTEKKSEKPELHGLTFSITETNGLIMLTEGGASGSPHE